MYKYTDKHDKVAFPIGGIGAGMFNIKSTGALADFSLRNSPDVMNNPIIFAAINLKAKTEKEHLLKVLTAPSSENELYYRKNDFCLGLPNSYYGIPVFEKSTFQSKFPFANINLIDKEYPVSAKITAWSPFTPPEIDSSCLPFGALEYQLTNTTNEPIEGVFYFNSFNFMDKNRNGIVRRYKNGFILEGQKEELNRNYEGYFSAFIDDENVKVNTALFRGGWFDARSMLVKDMLNFVNEDKVYADGAENSSGASLSLAFKLLPNESKTIKVCLTWYVPYSDLRVGPGEPIRFHRSDDIELNDTEKFYRPFYATKFKSIEKVCDYVSRRYNSLRRKSKRFSDAFFKSTLPKEIIEAVEANLSILKSPTILRQHDGKFWAWEGCRDDVGSCHGTCTHVWNYAQSLSHLFPEFERSLRNTEFFYSQNEEGHQAFRAAMPIQEEFHTFHAAADGQLGGIMKVYREFTVLGDIEFLRRYYPKLKASLDYCIKTWDTDRQGALFEPHHNTYDIEFWGADAMCTGFYLGALTAFIKISEILGENCKEYVELAEKTRKYMETNLYDGEYFIQDDWSKGVKAERPKVGTLALNDKISPDAANLFEKEGPKYQYLTGCLSDGLIGEWLASVCGIDTGLNKDYVKSHLNSVYKYNMKKDFRNHINPQRPGYMFRNEGGLLLCTWPKGGRPSLPFVYSDEVWTGIEYQVASHLISIGEVEKGLDIVKTLRNRYNGKNRNPYDEIECGHWYARAMASYALIEAYTGISYNSYEKTLYYKQTDKKTVSFLAGNEGYALVIVDKDKVELKNIVGKFDVEKFVIKN